MLTAEEYYRRKQLLEIEQRQIDKEHIRAHFKLNDRIIELENEWEKILRERENGRR